MWKKYGDTAKAYAARNIITDKFPQDDETKKFVDSISIKGLYYMDSNGDFDIYTEEKKNYQEK